LVGLMSLWCFQLLPGSAVCLASVLQRVSLPLGQRGLEGCYRRVRSVEARVDRLQHLDSGVPRVGAAPLPADGLVDEAESAAP
jgi:hypothetical protein